MNRALSAALIIALVPCLGQAQSSGYSNGHGYISFAPGGIVAGHDEWNKPTIQVGVGAEAFFRPHWGLGADLAYLRSPGEDRVAPRNWVILSPRIVARLRLPDEKNRVEPFVTGGYSLIVRQHSPNGVVYGETPRTWWETENSMNFGGGVNWWFARSVGLRLEFRDYARPFGGYIDRSNLVSVCIGLALR